MIICCRTLTEMLTLQREGKLTGWQRFKVRLHLWICGYCRTYSRQMDATVAATKTLKEPPAEQVREALVASFRQRMRAK
jgi:predicted anti-sigma-YlaC factor YlaD